MYHSECSVMIWFIQFIHTLKALNHFVLTLNLKFREMLLPWNLPKLKNTYCFFLSLWKIKHTWQLHHKINSGHEHCNTPISEFQPKFLHVFQTFFKISHGKFQKWYMHVFCINVCLVLITGMWGDTPQWGIKGACPEIFPTCQKMMTWILPPKQTIFCSGSRGLQCYRPPNH